MIAPPQQEPNDIGIIFPNEDELMNQVNLMSTDTIALLFKLTPRRVQQLTAEGILKQTKDVSDHGKKKYDLVPTVQAYIEYLSNKAYGRANKETDEIKRKKIEADTDLRNSQLELHRLKVSIARGEYLSVEEIVLDYQRFFVSFKKMAMAIAPRTAAKLNGKLTPTEVRTIEREIDKELKTMLRTFTLAAVEAANENISPVRPTDKKEG